MAGMNGITSLNGLGASGGVTDDSKLTKHLQSARVGTEGANKNIVVPDSVKKKAEPLLAALPSTTKPGPTEQGHGTGPTPEQKAKAEWETKKAAYDAAKATNAPLDARLAELTQQKTHLETLFNSGQLKGDGVLTWKELEWLAQNGTPEQKTAAQWMKDNKADFWDSMEKASTMFDVDGTANLNGEPVGRGLSLNGFVAKSAEMNGYISQVRAQKVPMPADPGTPPVGTTNTPPTTSPAPATGTSATANLDAVPAFASTGTTGEARLLDGIDHCQAQMDALEKDITACKDNPAQMQALNNRYTKLQTAQSMLMQLLKQRTEMMNNIQKMYSEMAMSAVRNMR